MKERIQQLCEAYRTAPRIGIVAGAGVSKDSQVPDYVELARNLFQDVCNKKLSHKQAKHIEPKKLIQYVIAHLQAEENLAHPVKRILYEKVKTGARHKTVLSETYRGNTSLDAIISFCVASPGSSLARNDEKWEINPRVGGILTTNYDNLIEGSYGSKYRNRQSYLKPVARDGSKDALPDKEIIPVYHMHGYISYIDDKNAPDNLKASNLVISEVDYYEAFYNTQDFGNVVASKFLQDFPCLFIGCSMQDENIRRLLYQTKQVDADGIPIKRHFAILPHRAGIIDDIEDGILESFGVTVIRLPGKESIGEEIEAILKIVYTSLDGVTDEHWRRARRGGDINQYT